jgi:hypothetical protein
MLQAPTVGGTVAVSSPIANSANQAMSEPTSPAITSKPGVSAPTSGGNTNPGASAPTSTSGNAAPHVPASAVAPNAPWQVPKPIAPAGEGLPTVVLSPSVENVAPTSPPQSSKMTRTSVTYTRAPTVGSIKLTADRPLVKTSELSRYGRPTLQPRTSASPTSEISGFPSQKTSTTVPNDACAIVSSVKIANGRLRTSHT